MPWRRFEGSRFSKLHRTLRSFGFVPLFPVQKVDKVLREFCPEVVLTVMQHATWYDSAMFFAKAKGLPLITIVHDTNENFDKVFAWAKDAQRKADRRFYQFAKIRCCVSSEMEEFCFLKFGVHGEIIYPNRDESLRPRPIEMNLELRSAPHLTVGFVGNVNYGYGKAMVDLLPVFESNGVRLRIWSQLPGDECWALRGSPIVRFEGFLPSPDVWEPVKESCDAVILPYSYEEKMKSLYSYHFPSKLTEYLVLGMPVIVTGPDYATGTRWAQSHPEAAVTTCDSNKLGPLLKKLTIEGEFRAKLAREAAKIAEVEFGPVKIRQKFLSLLASAAGKN